MDKEDWRTVGWLGSIIFLVVSGSALFYDYNRMAEKEAQVQEYERTRITWSSRPCSREERWCDSSDGTWRCGRTEHMKEVRGKYDSLDWTVNEPIKLQTACSFTQQESEQLKWEDQHRASHYEMELQVN